MSNLTIFSLNEWDRKIITACVLNKIEPNETIATKTSLENLIRCYQELAMLPNSWKKVLVEIILK